MADETGVQESPREQLMRKAARLYTYMNLREAVDHEASFRVRMRLAEINNTLGTTMADIAQFASGRERSYEVPDSADWSQAYAELAMRANQLERAMGKIAMILRDDMIQGGS